MSYSLDMQDSAATDVAIERNPGPFIVEDVLNIL